MGLGHTLPALRFLFGLCFTGDAAGALDSNTVQVEVTREDGSTVGQGTYAVSADGKLLTATTSGFDTQLRPFKTRTVWDRP